MVLKPKWLHLHVLMNPYMVVLSLFHFKTKVGNQKISLVLPLDIFFFFLICKSGKKKCVSIFFPKQRFGFSDFALKQNNERTNLTWVVMPPIYL